MWTADFWRAAGERAIRAAAACLVRTRDFWKAAGERAIRAAAACLVSLITVASFDPTDAMGWRASLIAAGMAALVSLLMSVAAGTVGDPTDPSFISRKDSSNGNQG